MAFYTDFAGHYEKIFPFKPAVHEFLAARLPTAGRVLDIGCGTGRYCGSLARTGRACLGIDLDPGMIAEAERLHPDGDFRLLGMEEIGLLPTGAFTGVFCIGNVLPHLPAGRLAAFLIDVEKLLAPGGVWIFQTVNFDPLLALGEFAFPDLDLDDGTLTFQRWYEDIRPDRLTFHTSLLGPDGEIFAGDVLLYPRTARDYLLGHRSAGFEKLGHYADFQGRGFDPDTISGSVFVFRKPA